jgi:hypothetical protein
MSRRLFLVFAIIGAIGLHPADASTGDSSRQGISDFQKNNPDVRKYEFARSYITALGYLKAIDDRWNKKVKVIRASVNDLAEDNADLRIFKNYLVKYQDSPNGLIRKITNTVVTATGREIAVNDDEKTLWEEWYDLNKAGQATRPKEVDFVKAQHALALRRKEADKDIVQTSVLLTKVLMSDKNADSHGRRLAITSPNSVRNCLINWILSVVTPWIGALSPGRERWKLPSPPSVKSWKILFGSPSMRSRFTPSPEVLVVEASAGSGKTYELAKRYVQLSLYLAAENKFTDTIHPGHYLYQQSHLGHEIPYSGFPQTDRP